MERYLAADYEGAPFKLFGGPHLVALGLILAFNVALIGVGEQFPLPWRTPARFGLAALLVVQEISMHAWRIATGTWTYREHLPLHLCTLAVWLGAILLVTQSYPIYEFVYLLGLPGALQALLTPDAGPYGFPHYRFFQVLLSHGAIVVAGVYMTAVEGFRPVPASLLRVLLFGNLYMLAVYMINRALGSNYLFINHKPETASILDVLPAWPWYIPYIEGMGAMTLLLLYLPFLIGDLRG